MSNKLICVLLATLLSACTTWHHPIKSQQEFNGDNSSCKSQAGYGTSNQIVPVYNNGNAQLLNQLSVVIADLNRNEIYGGCMNGKGWNREGTTSTISSNDTMACSTDSDCSNGKSCRKNLSCCIMVVLAKETKAKWFRQLFFHGWCTVI